MHRWTGAAECTTTTTWTERVSAPRRHLRMCVCELTCFAFAICAHARARVCFKGGHKFEASPPSAEAQRDDEAARLWALSAQLVGLPQA